MTCPFAVRFFGYVNITVRVALHIAGLETCHDNPIIDLVRGDVTKHLAKSCDRNLGDQANERTAAQYRVSHV